MTGITFLQKDTRMASTRLRNIIPFRELRRYGYTSGSDVVVISKHNWTEHDVFEAGVVIFDICDDHFDHPELGDKYRKGCDLAKLVTCNSESMRVRIAEATGREAILIDDPYEDPELPASVSGSWLCWFGHGSNLIDLQSNFSFKGDWPIKIVDPSTWTMREQQEVIDACRAVFLPTGNRQCKSANRAVTAIRRGRFVVAGELPSYREIPGIWVGDLSKGVEFAMTEDTTERTREAQRYVAERFNPRRIGEQWHQAIQKALSD